MAFSGRNRSAVEEKAKTITCEPWGNAGRNELFYQFHDGGLEAMVQGYRNGLLKPADYNALCQCESLQEVKAYLQNQTAYGAKEGQDNRTVGFLQDEATLTPKIIQDKCREELVLKFQEIREWSDAPLSEFLDFIAYDFMIQNILKLIQGARSQRPELQVLRSLHPLGRYEGMAAVTADCDSIKDLYETMTVLELPVVRFFNANAARVQDDAGHIQQVRAIFKKSYLEAFYDLCQEIGGTTFDVMGPILEFEADHQVLTIAKNLQGNAEIHPGYERLQLFPNIGTLVDFHSRDMSGDAGRGGGGQAGGIAEADDDEALTQCFDRPERGLRQWLKCVGGGGALGEATGRASAASGMEAELKKLAIEGWKDALNKQFNYGTFYAWVKLTEHEIANINWICECIEGHHQDRIRDFIPIYTDEEINA